LIYINRGAKEGKVDSWRKPDEIHCVKEVGIEEKKMKDGGLFTLLEWGATEVVFGERGETLLAWANKE
jgi:hypothetical protein